MYDNSITRDATNSKVCKVEANHTAKMTDCALYDAANKGHVQLIMDVVRYTWYRELKSPTTFYTDVTDLQFFNYLISNCSDLHETATITIQESMVKL